jgi:hypothetical protein
MLSSEPFMQPTVRRELDGPDPGGLATTSRRGPEIGRDHEIEPANKRDTPLELASASKADHLLKQACRFWHRPGRRRLLKQ